MGAHDQPAHGQSDDADVVWLSSIRPDGRPHLVAAWFIWDGDSIVVMSKPGAQKVRNVRHDPHVMIGIGRLGGGGDVELVEAMAEVEPSLDDTPTLPDGFVQKYAAMLARLEVTAERFAWTYSQVIRIQPTRRLAWGAPGW